MTGPGCSKSKGGKRRKHTPIVSEAQRGMMGAELGRRKDGKPALMPTMTTTELQSHLRESKGKDLPARAPVAKRGGNMQRKSYDTMRRRESRANG